MARTVVEGTYTAPAAATLPAARSGTAWGAIIGGAMAATAVTVILMLLGSGLGLTIVSPWDYAGVTATTFAVSTVIWLIVTQWFSAAIGGYIAGRLRTRWDIPADEVFFRDTAHGFITWALSTLIVAGLLTSSMAAITGAATQAAATVAAGGAVAAAPNAEETGMPMASAERGATDMTGYLVDRLFRVPSPPGVGAPMTAAESRAETQRILATGATGEIAAEDRAYLAQLVASRAGVSPAEAESRVDAALQRIEAAKAEAQAAADEARKVAASMAILGALALVIGAFIASAAAALGGRLRDDPTR
jgi:hypothetical protein